MLIWTGGGILAPIFFILAVGIGSFLGETLFPGNRVLQSLTFSFSVMLFSFLLWKISKHLNDPKKNRVLIDKETNREVVIKPRHTLFFIKLEYWAIFMGVVGFLSLFAAVR